MRVLIAILVVVIGIWVVLYPGISQQETSQQSSETVLREALQTAAPGSATSESILKTLRKIRSKKNRVEGENPDPFYQALREIKTGNNGETYPQYYQTRELAKARAFKTSRGMKTQSLDWVSRGPNNVSGRSRGIAVDPSDASGNTWFAATVGGGVWKTTDAGDSWTHLTADMPTQSVSSIAISESNPDVIYIGTGMGYGRVVDLEGSGVWKSTDHGKTWQQLTTDGLYDAINRIIIDPEDEDVVVLCANNSYTSIGPNGGDRRSGIFRTTDGGDSWTLVFDPDERFGTETDNRIQQVVATPGDFNTLFATVNEIGVVKSINGGVTWGISAIDFALSEDIGYGDETYSGVSTRTEIAISPSNPNKIYASVERPRGTAALIGSLDGGITWGQFSRDNDSKDLNWHSAFGNSGADGAYTSGWFNNTIVVDPFDENTIYVGGVNLFKITIASGQYTIEPIAWWFAPNEYQVPAVHADHHMLVTIPSGNSFRMISANDGGVAYSPDGITWEQKSGMVSTQFYGADKKPGEDIFIGGTQDNGTWIGAGIDEPWSHVIGGDGFEAVWNSADPMQVLGSSQNGNIKKSYDGGNSFQTLSQANSGGPFITKIANSTADPDLVFSVTNQGVQKSDDFGETWVESNLSPWIGYRPFSNVKISDANPQVVWAASRLTPDLYQNSGGIYVSEDGGNTFANVSSSLPANVNEISGMATDPLDGRTAYLLFSAPGVPKILKTTDLGETWEDLSGFTPLGKFSPTGFPDVAVFSLLVMPYDPEIIWAGTEIGLFVSENGGDTWAIANGFPPVSVFEMKLRDAQAILATYGRGIWTAEIEEMKTYTSPEVTLAPRLRTLALHPTGDLILKADFRSEYDSAHIVVDETVSARMYSTTAGTDTVLAMNVSEDKIVTAQVVGFTNGNPLYSGAKSVKAFPSTPQDTYLNLVSDFDAGADFTGDLFQVASEPSFSTFAFHTQHPYPADADLTYQLRIPIVVSDSYPVIRYKDVLLIEPGNVDDWNDADFFDYVIVEGTKDGETWLPLGAGYDSRSNTAWQNAFDTGIQGSDSLFVSHQVTLTETFDSGDIIFIRFRLHSDPAVTGWGWAVDNLVIQQEIVTRLEEPLPPLRIYPNPVNDMLHVEGDVAAFKIVTMEGKFLMENRLFSNTSIDVRGLKTGSYILQATMADGQQYSIRFAKN